VFVLNVNMLNHVADMKVMLLEAVHTSISSSTK